MTRMARMRGIILLILVSSTCTHGCEVKPTSLEEDSLTVAPIRDGSIADSHDMTTAPIDQTDRDVTRELDGDIDTDASADQELPPTCQPNTPLIERELGRECDGVDNDCDGFIDEHFTGQLEECGEGVCSVQSITVCDDGVEVSTCRDDDPAGVDDTCDLVDDDCDGRIDEAYLPTEISCGIGLCQRIGIQVCTAAGLQSTCVASEPPEGELDADCDGIDDDCDGSIDEGYQDEVVTCGEGSCIASGQRICNLGTLETICEPGEPGVDMQCDGQDNDCDGRIDESFFSARTECGEGVCRATGRLICTPRGIMDTCTPSAILSNQDLCDGLDIDCDGRIDEDHIEDVTSCGAGLCAQSGSLRCQEGQVVDTCTPGGPLPSDAECDNIDQDCDGRVDEGYQGTPVDCGVGACSASAVTTCVMGTVRDNCVAIDSQEADDSCDGVDQDCDNIADEHYVPVVTFCGSGLCLRVGETSCVNGQVQDSCQPAAPADGDDDSSCDGTDSDCDDRIDEGYTVQLVTCGAGACQTSGLWVCSNGGQNNQCIPLNEASPDDQCDGLDNDCDELIDEGYTDVASVCGVGACQQTGSVICTSEGTTRDTCEALSPPPGDSDQSCDGVDSDCDGRVDEGYQTTVTTCGVGACARSGQRICQMGVISDTCEPGAPASTDDTCNLSDNDCDGRIDEDYEIQQVTCTEGACSADGEVLCTAQGLANTCVVTVRENDPTCDGVDDDCDGIFDENYVAPNDGATVICGLGACQNEGGLECVNGSVTSTCEPLDPPSTSDMRCDGIDSDCDGVSDEDFSRRSTCGVGVCQVEVDLTCNNGLISTCIPRAPRFDYDVCGSRQDDNCDGVINRDYLNLGQPCSVGLGLCRTTGQYVCNGQLDGIVCLAEIPSPKIEICDFLDNDCDGEVDESCRDQ